MQNNEHINVTRKCGCSVEAEMTRRARKHELIARAYRRRNEFITRGRLSISLGGSRQDPVAFCLDHTAPADYPDDGKHERCAAVPWCFYYVVYVY